LDNESDAEARNQDIDLVEDEHEDKDEMIDEDEMLFDD